MYAPPPDSTVCGSCQKTQSQLGNPLKRCAKCQLHWYCSRECQKTDWKSHKKTCGSSRPEPAEPTSMFDSAASTGYRKNPQAVCYMPDAYMKLENGTWLQDRPKKDVFKLLVDTYRMKLEDEYVFKGDVEEGSLYSGAGAESALRHFRRFLTKIIKLDAARKKSLLPKWWSKDSLKECLHFAKTDDFSNVGLAAEKDDFQTHYGQVDMPMQMRMFYQQLDGI